MNNQFTDQQLDEIDITKPHLRHVLTDNIEVLVKQMAKMYNKPVDKDFQMGVANRLVGAGFRYLAIKNGLNRLVETHGRFPSYAEITASIRPFCNPGELIRPEDVAYIAEEKKYQHYKTEMVKLIGGEGVVKYFNWWCKHVPPFHIDPVIESPYLKCAIFDWVDGGMGNNFDKIKAVGIEKFTKANPYKTA